MLEDDEGTVEDAKGRLKWAIPKGIDWGLEDDIGDVGGRCRMHYRGDPKTTEDTRGRVGDAGGSVGIRDDVGDRRMMQGTWEAGTRAPEDDAL